jgi:hypothetical protein
VEETPAGNAGTAVVNRGPVNALSEDTAAEAKSSGKMDTSEEGQQESSPSKEAGSDVRSGYRQKKERFGQRPGGFSGQNGVNDRQPDGDSSGVHHRNYPAARNRYEGPGQKYQRNKEHRETTRLYNAHVCSWSVSVQALFFNVLVFAAVLTLSWRSSSRSLCFRTLLNVK